MTFRHPAFAKLATKLERAASELARIETHERDHASEVAAGEWGAISALALGLHNIYNGLEDVLLSLANDVDGLVPRGETMHQDLLDQMHSDIAGLRPAVLDAGLYAELAELKGFRHLVRHRYGFELNPAKVLDNVSRTKRVLPRFQAAIVALEEQLLKD